MMKMFLPLMMAGLMSMLFLGHKSKWGMILLIEVLLIFLIFSLPINEVVEVVTSWVALDIMSAGLVMLSVYLVLLMYLSSTSIFNTNNHVELYCLTSILLLLSLIFCFAVSSYLLFYLFFELSLIPTFIIIMGWGYQPERLQAGVYLILYTLLASLPLLFILMKMNTVMGSLWMWDYLMGQWCLNSGYWFSLMVSLGAMFAFLVKLPMFVTHLWLPKAHLEAPVAGSMILAGVLLKLGGYGLMRVLVKLYSGYLQMSVIFFSLSLVGMVVVGVMCCRLNDLKALVAYSSVAHMGLVICGSLTGTSWGFNGSLMMMISHGLGSSGLFCMVNVMYERLHSRSMHLNSGVLSLMPIFSLLMFLLCCSNISAPPTINLLSEISLLTSIFSFDGVGMLVFPLGSFFGAVFTFYMFSLSQHGKFYRVVQSLNLGMLAEMHVLVLHVLAINLLILKNDLFFSVI